VKDKNTLRENRSNQLCECGSKQVLFSQRIALFALRFTFYISLINFQFQVTRVQKLNPILN